MVTGLAERIAVVAGAGLVVYGVSMLSHAAGVILAGLFLLAGALWRTRA